LPADDHKAGGDTQLFSFERAGEPGHSPDLSRIVNTSRLMRALVGKHLKP
jgi:hypothetical protein